MVTHKIHAHGLVAGSERFHFVGMFGAASQILMLLRPITSTLYTKSVFHVLVFTILQR